MRELLPLLAFVWFGMLVFVALAAYSYGWWWRGRCEAKRRLEIDKALWGKWNDMRNRQEERARLEAQSDRANHRCGPPNLRVVE